jgi:hypothetical protein
VQLLEQLEGLGVFFDLDQVLACAGDGLGVVLLALLDDPPVHF